MSLANRAADLYFTFKFIKILTTPWEETDAFKLGIIDADGRRIRSKKIQSSEEKTAYTTLYRLVFNMKRLLNRLPGGSSKIASYAAALVLLREEFNLGNQSIEKLCKEADIDTDSFISEKNEWYVLENKLLSPGIYKVYDEKITTEFNEIYPKDKIRISENSYPVTNIFGLDVYKGTHINTNQPVYLTLGEIYK